MLKTMGILAAVLVAGAGIFISLEAEGVDVCCVAKEAKVEEPASESAIPLVCTLTDPELRGRRGEVGKLLSSYARSVKEFETGYSIAFENGHATEIVEFIELERECCNFFEFALTFEAGQGPTTLTISGPEGAKEFLRDTMESWKKKDDTQSGD